MSCTTKFKILLNKYQKQKLLQILIKQQLKNNIDVKCYLDSQIKTFDLQNNICIPVKPKYVSDALIYEKLEIKNSAKYPMLIFNCSKQNNI